MATPLHNDKNETREATEHLIALLKTLSQDRVTDPHYLNHLASWVIAINSLIKQPHDEDENLDDALFVLKNILTQSLYLPNGEEASLFSASEEFNKTHTIPSHLSLMATSFLDHPDATTNLIRELELLSQELY